jgi:hypothetical protein
VAQNRGLLALGLRHEEEVVNVDVDVGKRWLCSGRDERGDLLLPLCLIELDGGWGALRLECQGFKPGEVQGRAWKF